MNGILVPISLYLGAMTMSFIALMVFYLTLTQDPFQVDYYIIVVISYVRFFEWR